MSLLDWFKRNPIRFTRFDDAFALTRTALWKLLRQTVESPRHSAKTIWLVVHFTDTFAELQSQLDQWQLDYEIVTCPIDPNQLERSGLLAPSQIQVVLAEMIPADMTTMLEPSLDHTIAMIVVERHPNVRFDLQLETFARSLPRKVEFGHYLALEDEVVKTTINETSIKLLRQLGMSEHELITSNMVTRRLDKVLARAAESYRTNHPADSAKQWLELNGSLTRTDAN